MAAAPPQVANASASESPGAARLTRLYQHPQCNADAARTTAVVHGTSSGVGWVTCGGGGGDLSTGTRTAPACRRTGNDTNACGLQGTSNEADHSNTRCLASWDTIA